ncbi:MAG: AAA family ATPase [Candidatus Lokiarchaeota archaeon]|nr:AAA family ATPase [Candidatus Lokiarchaeota archaeon]
MNSKKLSIKRYEIKDIVAVNNDVDIFLYKILNPLEFFCFFVKYKSARLLEKSWSKLNSSIASYFQSELTNEFQIWNIYIVFACEDDVKKEIKYKIENDRFSSRKIVLDKIESLNESIIKDIIINKITNTNLELEQNKDQKDERSLKIKKVEIDAFRAFKSKENGTFDFTLENGECADFISIYAPNGFGKTSFYDAVEWGLTGNIYRLLRNKELAKEERSQSEIKEGEKQKQYILKNRESSSLRGTVIIQTTQPVPIKNETKEVTHKGRTDYNFIDDTPDEKKYIRDIILSQDGIDSFVKEDKPEDRYNKFIYFFGDNDLDTEYNSIEENIKKNKEELIKIKSEIKELKNKIAIEVDTNIFEGINKCIDLLNSNGEKIPHVNESFDETKEQKLQELIESRKLYLIAEIKRCDEEIEKLKNILSKKEWINIQIKDKTELESKKNKLESIRRDINIKSETEKKLSYLKEELSKKIESQKVFFEIKKILPEYHSIQSKLNSLQKKKVSLKDDLNGNEELRLKFIRERDQFSQNIHFLTEEKLYLEELLTNAPFVFQSLDTKRKDLLKIKENKSNIEESIGKNRIKKENLSLARESLIRLIADINNEIYTDLKNYLIENKSEDLENGLIEILDIELKLEKLNVNMDNIENRILEQKELDLDLQKLVDIGYPTGQPMP